MTNYTPRLPDWASHAMRSAAADLVSLADESILKIQQWNREHLPHKIASLEFELKALPEDIAIETAEVSEYRENIALCHQEAVEGNAPQYLQEADELEELAQVHENNIRSYMRSFERCEKELLELKKQYENIGLKPEGYEDQLKFLWVAVEKIEGPLSDFEFEAAYNDLLSAIGKVEYSSGLSNVLGQKTPDVCGPLMARMNGIYWKKTIDRNLQSKPDVKDSDATETNIQLLSIAELLQRPPVKWLIKDTLPEKGVAILAGQSGHLKSFLSIALGLSVATGVHVGRSPVVQKGVIYMLNEGQAGIGLRCQGWLEHHKVGDVENFKIIEHTPNLMRADTIVPYIDAIDSTLLEPGLIILDTFSKATVGGEDNSTSDMAIAIETAYQIASHFGALVMIIDHVGKDPKRGLRGAYSKYANVDMVGMVTKNGSSVTLLTQKQKEGEDGLTFTFKVIEQAVQDRETLVLIPCDEQRIITQPQYIKTHIAFNGSTDRQDLHEAFVQFFGEQARDSFKAVLKRLIKKGEMKEVEGVIYVLD